MKLRIFRATAPSLARHPRAGGNPQQRQNKAIDSRLRGNEGILVLWRIAHHTVAIQPAFMRLAEQKRLAVRIHTACRTLAGFGWYAPSRGACCIFCAAVASLLHRCYAAVTPQLRRCEFTAALASLRHCAPQPKSARRMLRPFACRLRHGYALAVQTRRLLCLLLL